jgi:hypothetical protein
MTDPNNPIVNVQYPVEGEQPAIVPQGTNNSESSNTQQGATGQGSATGTVQNASGQSSATTVPEKSAVSAVVPDEYKVSNNAELIAELERRRDKDKPLSPEDLKKLRRKQKIEGIISGVTDAAEAMSNLLFTTQYAPNMYNAANSMSAKTKERWDKEKAERDAADDKFLNYSLQIAKLKGEDADRGLNIWKAENDVALQNQAYNASREDHKEEVAFRNKDFDERVREWNATFKRDSDQWERQFSQSIKQFNVTSSIEKSRLALEGQRLAQEIKNGSMTFNCGSVGNITLTKDKINMHNISRIYNALEDKFKNKPVYKKDDNGNIERDGNGRPIIDHYEPKLKNKQTYSSGGYLEGEEPPSAEAMLVVIGDCISESPNAQKVLQEVAGKRPTTTNSGKGRGY